MANSEFVNSAGPRTRVRSPLGVVAARFDQLASHPVPTDPSPAPGRAGGGVESWAALREVLRDPQVPIAVVDAVWVWLIQRSRAHGGDATLMCASLAEPMLARTVGRFAAASALPGIAAREDLESEVLTGFLTHLGRVELDRPGVWHRLRWAAYRAAIRAANHQQPPVGVTDLAGDLAADGQARVLMRPEPGHPETVLAEAVGEGVISAEAARLIADTRWERRTLTSLAAERGQSVWKLRKQRRRAEARLVAWLTDPDVETTAPALHLASHAPTPAPTRTGTTGTGEVRACA